MSARTMPELDTVIAHLGEVLGDQTYESAMATYAFEQIDQARVQLTTVAE